MAVFIEGPRNLVVDHARLARIRNSGKPMEVRVAITAGRHIPATQKLWLRFVTLEISDPFDPTKIVFDGYLGNSYLALEKTLDLFDASAVQYVRGTTSAPAGHGQVTPAPEGTGDEAPGAEPFMIERLPHGNPEVVGIVMARSEVEAAMLCGFSDTKNPFRDRPVYRGRISQDADAGSNLLQVTRLRDLPKFPPR